MNGNPELLDEDLEAMASGLKAKVEDAMDRYQFSSALTEIWKLVARTNKYIDETAPWALGKDPEKKARLATVLYHLAESLRIISILIAPFMPETMPKIQAQIGAQGDAVTWDSAGQWGLLPSNATLQKGEILFPRIDVEKEIAALNELLPAKAAPKLAQPKEEIPQIKIDDFQKIELRVAKVKACEPVKRAKSF